MFGAQMAWPDVLAVLRRAPGALADGQVWRLLSPLLVQSDGLPQLASNLLLLTVAGSAAEPALGRGMVVSLYLAGGLAGNLAGCLWDPTGAGSSVGVLGLFGGLATLALRQRRMAMSVAVVAPAALMALLGARLGGLAGAMALAAVTGSLTFRLARQRPRAVAAGMLGIALLLCLARDLHGPAVLAGAALAPAFRPRQPETA